MGDGGFGKGTGNGNGNGNGTGNGNGNGKSLTRRPLLLLRIPKPESRIPRRRHRRQASHVPPRRHVHLGAVALPGLEPQRAGEGDHRAVVGAQFRAREAGAATAAFARRLRSEEHTSELQSLMRISYAVFCFKNKIKQNTRITVRTIDPYAL